MMKKYLIFAAAALTLAACSNDDENLNDGPVAIRLSSSLEVQTRAANDIQGSVFDANEKVGVFIQEAVAQGQTATTTYPQPLVYTTGTAGAMNPSEQPYFPSSGNGVNIYAYYPSETVSSMDESTVTFTVQTDQSTDADYKASDLMYGSAENPVSRTTDAIKVTFKHLLSKVTVTLTPGDGNPDLSDAKVSLLNICPDAQLTASTGTIADGTEAATNITVTADGSVSGSAIIPPQTVSNGTQLIEVQLSDGGKLYYTLDEDATFQSGKVYAYNIKVNLTGLEVSSDITDWTTDSEYPGGNGNATMQQS